MDTVFASVVNALFSSLSGTPTPPPGMNGWMAHDSWTARGELDIWLLCFIAACIAAALLGVASFARYERGVARRHGWHLPHLRHRKRPV
jgi:hypothetical protein